MTDHSPDPHDLIRRLAYALDVALPELVRLANEERERYPGYGLREITHQKRLSMARGTLAEASDLLGVPLGEDEEVTRAARGLADATLDELVPAAARALSLMQAMGWREATQADGLTEDDFVEALAAETAYAELRDALPTPAVFSAEFVRDPLAAARIEAERHAQASKEVDSMEREK